ncbi:MAG: phosphoribosylanthranilate isomerase [Verrucomicrobia bacterium]|nr:phosphoribosylanthranilate isomerase [Verrucomicrobiota bacterium]MCF7707653.1 phosphoribosylanthranilate isomerase [Verrucomicrobiota bacterium]
MRTRIKICGITGKEDAAAAVDAGADALGFVFFPGSPRYITVERASEIIRELPPFVSVVGVFVNAGIADILRVVESCGLDVVQLHGDEPACVCAGLPCKVVKAFRIKEAGDLEALEEYDTDAWLLDSYSPGVRGGTGEVFNWELAAHACGRGRPVILAGGLHAGNVAEAVRVVRPYGVDVSSGVESEPGKKSSAKMRAFIKALHCFENG